MSLQTVYTVCVNKKGCPRVPNQISLELPERLCVNPDCGIAYKPRRTKQRYHSQACRYAHHNTLVRQALIKLETSRAELYALQTLIAERGLDVS